MDNAEPTLPFAEVLEAANRLTVDEQEELAAIIRRRLAERGRKRVVQEVIEARLEFSEGSSRPTTVDDLMNEIVS
jgi:hypothetical protein